MQRHQTSSPVEVVTEALSVAQHQGKLVRSDVQRLVKDHPFATIGVSLGSGLLLGAIAHRVFSHHDTLSELLFDRVGLSGLRSRLTRAVKALS